MATMFGSPMTTSMNLQSLGMGSVPTAAFDTLGTDTTTGIGVGSVATPTISSPAVPTVGGTGTLGATGATGAASGTGGGFWNNADGTFNFNSIGTIAQGLASLGQVYAAIKGAQLAQKQFDFTKDAYNTNLENQTQTYNTSLKDRIMARYAQEGRSTSEANSYYNSNKL